MIKLIQTQMLKAALLKHQLSCCPSPEMLYFKFSENPELCLCSCSEIPQTWTRWPFSSTAEKVKLCSPLEGLDHVGTQSMLSKERGTMETAWFGGFVQFDLEAEFLASMDSPKEKPEVRAQGWDMGLGQGDYSIRRHDSALKGMGKLLLKEDNLGSIMLFLLSTTRASRFCARVVTCKKSGSHVTSFRN